MLKRSRRGRTLATASRGSALAFWGVLAVLVAGAIVWRAMVVRRTFGEAVNATHALTAPGLVLQASAWARARAAHAATVAALLAADVGGGAGPRSDATARVAERFGPAMEVLAEREGFVSGRVLDRAGAVIVAVKARGDGRTPSHADHAPRVSITRAGTGAGDGPGRCG